MNKPKISLTEVFRSYSNQSNHISALENINLEVHDGEFLCIVGPSGCGKSTLLNMIAGLIHPTHGKVVVNDSGLILPDSDRILMFQESAQISIG